VLFLALLALIAVGYGVRLFLAYSARKEFCAGGCVTMAVRLKPSRKPIGWKHGYARLTGDVIEWRAEHRLAQGATLTFDRNSLLVREHHQVRKGETMLSELTELVAARYRGEDVELGVLRTDLDTFLGWPRG
jgi:hypothetical protein